MKRYKLELVVFGPASPNDSVRRAVTAIAAVCGKRAYEEASAASALAPELVSKIAAASAVAYNTFNTCIRSVDGGVIAAAIINQLGVKLEQSTRWAPL